jgi:hypothetical protein
MSNGVAGRTVVVPIKTIIDVLSDAHVVAPGICVTANDVNEPLSNALHAGATRTVRAAPEFLGTSQISGFGTQFLIVCADTSEQKPARFRIGGVRLRSLRELRRDSLRVCERSLKQPKRGVIPSRLPSRSSLDP